MNPAAPTPAPIHDIVGPIWVFPYPVWMVVAATLVALLLIAALFFGIRSLLKRKHPPTPQEIALAALEQLRKNTDGVDPYAFGVAVSDTLRAYIRAQHGLAATTLTSMEFLDSIRDNPVFTPNEKSGLAVFLEGTDLLKFARTEAGPSEMISLLETAGRLVRGEVQPDRKAGGAKP